MLNIYVDKQIRRYSKTNFADTSYNTLYRSINKKTKFFNKKL